MIPSCIDCKNWEMKTPPAIGTCKKYNKTVLNSGHCQSFESDKKVDMPDFLKDVFGKNFGGKI